MTRKFVVGMMAGAVAGIAASAYALNCVRPDVTAKLMRNGKRVIRSCRKQVGF